MASHQVEAELKLFIVNLYSVPSAVVEVAVVGLPLYTEHEVCCCVMVYSAITSSSHSESSPRMSV